MNMSNLVHYIPCSSCYLKYIEITSKVKVNYFYKFEFTTYLSLTVTL